MFDLHTCSELKARSLLLDNTPAPCRWKEAYLPKILIFQNIHKITWKISPKRVMIEEKEGNAMLGRAMGGKHTCFVCERILKWETEYKGYTGDPLHEESPVPAEGSAIGKMGDGVVIFEIACVCPKCKTKNKFRAERHVTNDW